MLDYQFSDKFIQRLKHCYNVAALTGEGISAESGIPAFLGKDGSWNNHDVTKFASVETLNKDPELFWDFFKQRREILADIKPNLGHYALVDLENLYKGFSLATQTVDGLHTAAGSKKIYELHGSINAARCSKCGFRAGEPDKTVESGVPRCPKCSELLRPDDVLFGEPLPSKVMAAAQEAAAACEVYLSIGIASMGEPAATLPYIAKANGAYIVEINVERTPLSDQADEVLIGPASEILPALAMRLMK